MSSSIWMRCEGSSELRPLQLTAWRVVESQHEVSTRKLVGSAAEQELLEQLLEQVKPPAPEGKALHYLLFTPFRYPPLRYGSRFGSRFERGIWYGAEQQRTAFAEVAYYRLLFLAGTDAAIAPVHTTLTSFTVRMRSARGIDLTAPPFDAHTAAISSRRSYRSSQAIGTAMREARVELFRFRSARDADGGTNIAAFTPAVFRQASPQHFEPWHCVATPDVVEFTRGGVSRVGVSRVRASRVRTTLEFARSQFLVEGKLPAPAV